MNSMSKKIQDEFTHLDIQEHHKQWLRWKRDGKCRLCGYDGPMGDYKNCRDCRKKSRDRMKASPKSAARKIMYTALRHGIITRQECQIKGCKAIGEGHHEDYSQPLKITWLCHKHHLEVHGKKIRFGKKEPKMTPLNKKKKSK